QSDAFDEAEINRCLERAAELVQGFADRGAISALDTVLATTGEPTPAGSDPARLVAAIVLQQTETLHDEVGRFLSLTKK
ncbi:MAG: hypothetical protein ACTSW2_10230, partial [Alphaproteobacteria bacterium]